MGSKNQLSNCWSKTFIYEFIYHISISKIEVFYSVRISFFACSSSKALKKEAAGFSSRLGEDSCSQPLFSASMAVPVSGGSSPALQSISTSNSPLIGRPIPRLGGGIVESSLTPPSNPGPRISHTSASSNHSETSHTPKGNEDGPVTEIMSLQKQLSVLSHALVNKLPIRAEQLLSLHNDKEVSFFNKI